MTETKPEPLYNPTRRMIILAALTAIAGALLTVAWYYAADRINAAAGQFISEREAEGTQIACPNRDVRGYPFRFGIFCDSLSVNDVRTGSVIEAGAVRSAAQVYEPTKIIAEIEGPIVLQADGSREAITLDVETVRTALHAAEPVPEQVSLTTGPASLKSGAMMLGSAEDAALHLRTNPENATTLDLAGRLQRLSVPPETLAGLGLPVLDADVDIGVENGVPQLASGALSLRGSAGTLRRFAVLLDDDAGILVSGPFGVDASGILSGEFKLRIIDADKVFAAMRGTAPQFTDQIALFETLPRTGDQGDEIELTLSVDQGRMRFGLIPLGTLPPLPDIR